MIQPFIDKFMSAREAIKAELATGHPGGYDNLVARVVEIVGIVAEGESNEFPGHDYPDPERITKIDHGHYQGTALYIIGAKGYQPGTYWSIFVSYGSCSGCDTFESIKGYDDEPPNAEQVDDYWTLMLHMAQSLTQVGGGE